MEKKKLSHDDYTVAWICPLEVEQVAALEMLDEEHQRLPQSENDHNAYNLGSIYGHNVVIAGLPTAGNCSAATVVAQMRNTYPRLRFGLLVGIGGGVPIRTNAGPIRLGHIVVSQPVGQHSGAVQYDHGKAEANEFVRTGSLAPPPMVLLNAARELQVSRRRSSLDPLISHLGRIDTTKRGFRNYKRPSADQDQLYEPWYTHLDKEKSCKRCGCDTSKQVSRDVDDSDNDSDSDNDGDDDGGDDLLVVHRGTIASGEAVMRNGMQRDALASASKILCFEMEAAGALNDFPCLVIRGISDYSDSHKNDKWHGYAAAVAAAYARELFRHMPVDEVKQCKIAETDVEKLVQNTQQSADYILDSRIEKWLRPSDASINLVNASNLRHPNTGCWFLESDRYKWLKSTSGARLWLRGIPGCGKTVLSSTIIENLRLNNRDTGPAIVYFFFSFSDESKQKLDHMLRSLISQLVRWDGSTGAHLSKLFESSYHGRVQPQMTQLVEVFNQMTSELRDVIVVLDALDESKDRRDLLRWITSSSNQDCKFILTSRSERDIEECFAPWLPLNSTITLESDLVGDDIEAYVHSRLKEEEHLSRWTSMHEEIVDTLVGKAAGMFRWVYCQLQELSECLDKPAVRRMLQTLPDDLNETYDRILQNIPRPRVPNAIKLLQLLTFSTRSLSLSEVIDAMATEPDMDLPFDLENRISPPEAIVGYCSSLVRITDASARGCYTRKHSKILQLAHFSVREYLLLERDKTPYNHFLETKVANAAIARIFLAYLWTTSETQSSLRLRRVNPVLIKLAARFWMVHAAAAGEEEEITFTWTRKIFMNGSFLQYWARLYNGSKTPHALPALHYASQFALHRSVDYLLSMGADPNVQGGSSGNALQAASTSGNVQIVQTLLEYSASVNAQGGFFGSALHAAAWYGHIDTLQLLLKYGAGMGAMEWQHGSTAAALQLAAYRGHVEIVKALLMHGADVNARNARISYEGGEPSYATHHYTALEAASYKGHTEVVKILLKNNAKVDASGPIHFTKGSRRDRSIFSEGYTYGTPLQAASRNGDLGIVRILVANGANVNIESGHLGYALHAALSKAHSEVSLFLIESGADIQARGGFLETALHAAVYEGGLAMVQLLVENRVNIDKANDSGETALYGACKTCRFQIVELLLDNGADVNLLGGDYGTALCAAINSGSFQMVQMVRLLLDYGADVNLRGGNHGTALRAAYMSIFGGTRRIEEIMQVLLDQGADPNAQNEGDDTLLYMACNRKDLSVAVMLLAHGADPNVQCGELGTALAAAAYKGSLELVQTLLNNGANPNARKDGGDTPLYIASHEEDLAIASMLLANGANPNIQGGKLGTALVVAFHKGFIELVEILLESGADPNARAYRDATLLYTASYNKDSKMATILLEFGADPNVQGGKLGTTLAAAVFEGSLEIVEMLLESGANPNVGIDAYSTLLFMACGRKDLSMAAMLLAHGADPNVQCGELGTALAVASNQNSLDLVQLLLNNGTNVNSQGGWFGNAL